MELRAPSKQSAGRAASPLPSPSSSSASPATLKHLAPLLKKLSTIEDQQQEQQPNDDEDDDGDDSSKTQDQAGKGEEDVEDDEEDDASSYTSNQTEDDLDDDDDDDQNDRTVVTTEAAQENDREDTASASIKTVAKVEPLLLPPLIRPSVPSKTLPAVLSVQVADPKKKGIQEPKPPRGGSGSSSSSNSAMHPTGSVKSDGKKARHKFQFPDTELLNLVLEDGKSSASSSSSTLPSSSSARFNAKRRFSSTAAVSATTLPLRRKSFSLTKSPIKKSVLPQPSPLSSPGKPSSSRFQSRRKSTSACYSLGTLYGSKSSLVSSLPPLPLPSIPSSTSSSMVLRVRERKSDGLPELVISKRPGRVLVWNWPGFKIQLGPHQHAVMLRQLRYVKSVMHELPWAKTHLKDLLASYTKKDTTKEELYPQLNHLSHQVQHEIGAQVKKQKQLVVKKQRLTMQLSLATSVLNELHVTKFGRRGKPHETKLYYDPGQPTRLHWVRKNGDRSGEFLEVDALQIHCYDAGTDESELSAGMKKAVKKFTPTLEHSVSLVTPARSLDLQLKSGLHRDWLVNALADVVSFARQYKAAGARRDHATHVLRRM